MSGLPAPPDKRQTEKIKRVSSGKKKGPMTDLPPGPEKYKKYPSRSLTPRDYLGASAHHLPANQQPHWPGGGTGLAELFLSSSLAGHFGGGGLLASQVPADRKTSAKVGS